MYNNIFDEEFISKIDMEKTANNGRLVFEQYQPLVEKRLKQLKTGAFNSTSILVFSEGTTGSPASDKLLKRLSWDDDQIASFIKNILKIQKQDKKLSDFLRLKCFYGYTDKEIAKELDVTDRTIRNYKSRAYYYLAVFSNQVEFIYEKCYSFYLD
ncbi:MAG: hypothetical protein J6D28_01175 [Bacilli bacterium]|nr:hypothetical protein [Bacilli bacterium]